MLFLIFAHSFLFLFFEMYKKLLNDFFLASKKDFIETT